MLWFGVLAVHPTIHEVFDDYAAAEASIVASGVNHAQLARQVARTASDVKAGQPNTDEPCAICEWLSASPASPSVPPTPLLVAAINPVEQPCVPRSPPVRATRPYHTRAPPALLC